MGPKERFRVLLLEENEVQRLIIREYLGMDPRLDVLEAKGAFHALTLSESELPGISLALLDMEYSKVDGVDLVLSLRRRNPGLVILGMTDRRPEMFSDPRLWKTRAGFIPKPFAPFHLHQSIATLLSLEGRGGWTPPEPILKSRPSILRLVQPGGQRVHGQAPA